MSIYSLYNVYVIHTCKLITVNACLHYQHQPGRAGATGGQGVHRGRGQRAGERAGVTWTGAQNSRTPRNLCTSPHGACSMPRDSSITYDQRVEYSDTPLPTLRIKLQHELL